MRSWLWFLLLSKKITKITYSLFYSVTLLWLPNLSPSSAAQLMDVANSMSGLLVFNDTGGCLATGEQNHIWGSQNRWKAAHCIMIGPWNFVPPYCRRKRELLMRRWYTSYNIGFYIELIYIRIYICVCVKLYWGYEVLLTLRLVCYDKKENWSILRYTKKKNTQNYYYALKSPLYSEAIYCKSRNISHKSKSPTLQPKVHPR